MAMRATVRAATPTDEAALFALTSAFPTPTPATLEVFRTLLPLKLADARSGVFVADAAGGLIGYVSGSIRLAFYAAGATAWVDEIYVLPEHRSAGVGAELMAAFEGWAADQDCNGVALATRAAAPFYERLGYTSRAAYLKKYFRPQPEAI
jgi:GNAT superfamily N-acetyltransferase